MTAAPGPFFCAMFSLPAIADAVCGGLEREAQRLDEEQAVHGIDALDELGLHPLLEGALRGAGFGVHREKRYPSDRRKRTQIEGERCDLVLTPDGRPLAAPEADPTLFDPPDAVGLADAFWLEVKVVAQFTPEGPNPRYASQLATPRHDVSKLSKDRGIHHAGVLVVLFAEDDRVVEHDLGLWYRRCLERNLPISPPHLQSFTLTDRIGNARCAVAGYGVRRRSHAP